MGPAPDRKPATDAVKMILPPPVCFIASDACLIARKQLCRTGFIEEVSEGYTQDQE